MNQLDEIQKIVKKASFYRKPGRFSDIPDDCSVELTKEEVLLLSGYNMSEVTSKENGFVNDYI